MYERYSDQARKVLYIARHEALTAGAPTVDVEHVLISLLQAETPAIRDLVENHGLNAEDLRREVVFPGAGSRLFSAGSGTPPWSRDARLLIEKLAPEASTRAGTLRITPDHLLIGILLLEGTMAWRLLTERGVSLNEVKQRLGEPFKQSETPRSPGKSVRKASLADFTRDLTTLAAAGALDPLVGREDELARVIRILARRRKNSPILLGEPGVGKSAVVEGLARKIASGDVPASLKGKRILELDLAFVLAGTKYRGQFEERMKSILNEVAENGSVILFLDELPAMVGTGGSEGSLDAAGILKPALGREGFQCIGTATFRDYKLHIEKDRALVRRFQPVKILPADGPQSITILNGIKDRYEEFHGVRYTDEAIRACVSLSDRYINDRFLPDKAIDLLDEAGAMTKISGGDANDGRTPVVDNGEVESVLSRWTGIPLSSLHEDQRSKLLRIEEKLHERIVGQEQAISALARAIRRSRAGIGNPRSPIGSFLFLGPTGVGKTEVAKTLAAFLFGDERAMVRLDMSEYAEKHSVSKMIGSPPGYVGFEEGGQLVERVKRKPYSLVLLDEIDKAHPDALNMLLQVLDEGTLTDSYGDTADFKNTIIIMTSNIGSRTMLQGGIPGFSEGGERTTAVKKEEVLKLLNRSLLPEFLNRIDEVVIFDPLTRGDLVKIAVRMIEDINNTLKEKSVKLAVEQGVAEFLVDACCSDQSFGARPLRRGVQDNVEDLLAEWLLEHGVAEDITVALSLGKGGLRLTQPELAHNTIGGQ